MPSLRAVLTSAFVATGSCLGNPTGPEIDPNATMHILFIGNSLTYYNDLPWMVKALADSAGAERTYVEMVAKPNYALEDHWADGDALARIRAFRWDFVVMQQGPSSVLVNRQNLIQWAERFALEIRAQGAVPVMFQVWPTVDRQQDFNAASESYRLAALAVNGRLAPGGEAWRATWRRDPAQALYAPDGLHPSVRGSYVAALALYATMYGGSTVGSPRGLSVPGGSFVLPTDAVQVFQAAADEAVAAAAGAALRR